MQDTISQQSLLKSKIITAVLALPTIILSAQNVNAEPIIAGVGSTIQEIIPSEKVDTIGLVDNMTTPQTSTTSQTVFLKESELSSSQAVSYECDLYSPLSNTAVIACQGFQTQPPSTLEGTSI